MYDKNENPRAPRAVAERANEAWRDAPRINGAEVKRSYAVSTAFERLEVANNNLHIQVARVTERISSLLGVDCEVATLRGLEQTGIEMADKIDEQAMSVEIASARLAALFERIEL